MSLYTEELNSVDDLVLDNYVALFRHAIGDKRMFVRHKPRPPIPPELKELWRKELRTCRLCKTVEFYPRYHGHRFCGNSKTQEGCAWIRRREGYKKSVKNSIFGKKRIGNNSN